MFDSFKNVIKTISKTIIQLLCVAKMLRFLQTLTVPTVGRNSLIRAYRRSGNRKPRDLAGMRNQQKIMGDVHELEEDPETTYDADFNELDQTYEDHQTEMAVRKEQLKYYVVKSRYFKTKQQPNFLTWAEKEKIRFLNKDDRDVWTPKKLSESFPAVDEVILKILKANWTPSNMQRIQKHDENVRKNWQLFKNGEMKGLDPVLEDHLKKFSNRQFDSSANAYTQTNNDQIQFQFPTPKTKEFSQIITSCKKLAQSIDSKKLAGSKPQIHIENKQKLLSDEKFKSVSLQVPKEQKNDPITFEELLKVTGSSKAEENDSMFLIAPIPKEDTAVESNTMSFDSNEVNSNDVETIANIDASVEKVEKVENTVITLTPNDVSSSKIQKYVSKKSSLVNAKKDIVPQIQHRIQIPKRLQKANATFRLYDCFYDDRGYFLYRVPGLA